MLGKKISMIYSQGGGGKKALNHILTLFNFLLFPCSSLDTNRDWKTLQLNLLHSLHPSFFGK